MTSIAAAAVVASAPATPAILVAHDGQMTTQKILYTCVVCRDPIYTRDSMHANWINCEGKDTTRMALGYMCSAGCVTIGLCFTRECKHCSRAECKIAYLEAMRR
jgi:hypothetical protein